MKWKTSVCQYSAGTLQDNTYSEYSGLAGPCLVDRVVSHGLTKLMWSDWSKLPSAWWDERGVKSVTGVYKLLFLLVGHTSDERDTKLFCPLPTYFGHLTHLRYFLVIEFSI